MDEKNTCILSSTTKTRAIVSSCKSSTADTSIISSVANNMETKGTNIPTNAHHHHEESGRQSSNNSNNSLIVSREANQATATTTTTSDSSSHVVVEEHGEKSNNNKDVDTDSSSTFLSASRKPLVTCEPNISNVPCEKIQEYHHHSVALNISSDIDPLKESTNTLASSQTLKPSSSELSTKKADICGKAKLSYPDPEQSSSNKVGQVSDNDNNKGAVISSYTNGKPPVPNFRVEGSGAGDSSITVAVASLSSAVSASISHGSTGGSNSLENGDQPGSSSGPVSIQSSEEMRLSLVSWYSEPEEIPSRLIEGCCSALNTYRTDDNGVVTDEIVDQSSSMGHDAILSATNSSPVCKSESEEKENKTPEPCGNIDKMSSDKAECTNATFTKSEFINLNNKKTDNDTSEATCNIISGSHDESQNMNQALAHKINESCTRNSTVKMATNPTRERDSSKARSGASSSSQKVRGNVHLHEQNKTCGSSTGGHTSRCQMDNAGGGRNSKPECPRCSRRSKSGTTTPASGPQIARASRRVVQSSKSSTEIKKPIKSILKHDSRGSASGSGSDKQSSMDSLGSSGDIGMTPIHNLRGRMPNTLMTRSDSGTRARFNFNSGVVRSSDTPTSVPQDKVVSKLKRIEKYATLRVRKNIKPRPLDFTEGQSSETASNSNGSTTSGKVGIPGVPTDMMSKSMSYLEKSSNRVHISATQGESVSASSTLKRQGSLRAKKGNTPQWEPSGTRTSALRLQKMQEAKAKISGGGGASSGSANSGSGDSLHYVSHSANSNSTASGGSSGMSSIHLSGSHSASSAHHHARMTSSAAAKEKHVGAKIFSKLSSALGQTASSNQKRIRQERGVQTDLLASNVLSNVETGRMSVSPIPAALDAGPDNVEQIKSLERLCNRYRNQYMRIQSDFEKSESKKEELQKQLEETQHESTEMIEFLQAEKSTLAESLTEVEVEAKKYKDEMEASRKDFESRCSSLVRLSEQHKQEALKSQALLHRLESQSTSVISQLSHQITDGAQDIYQTRQRITALTDSLLKTYKVPPELLISSETNQTIKETDLSCSLLLPLISSLSAAFPLILIPVDPTKPHATTAVLSSSASIPNVLDNEGAQAAAAKLITDSRNKLTNPSTSTKMTECSSLQSLNQAILEREAAEKSGLDDIMKPFSLYDGVSPDTDQVSLKKEIAELNIAIAKLLCLVRVIVIHCDRKVSSVASSILQCLKSIEDDKGGNIAEIAQVQKSLEAWSDKGITTGSTPTSTNNANQPFKTTTSPVTSDTTYLVGNGHAHV